MESQTAQGGAGWLRDPTDRYELRYWDGGAWTTAVMRDGQVDTDPLLLTETDKVDPVVPHSPVPLPDAPLARPPMPSGPLDRYTSLPPVEAHARLGQMFGMSGWMITGAASDRYHVTVPVSGQANVIIGLILCLFWVVPGVIYFILASRSKNRHATVVLLPEQGGTRLSVQADPAIAARLGTVLAQLPW